MSRSIIRITVPRLVGNCCGLPSEYLLEMVFTSKWGPEWSPNGSQMAPQRPLGASWPAEGLLERSWRALGELLERSWAVLGPKKVIGNGSWAAQGLGGNWFQRGLGPKSSENGAQGGPQIGARKRTRLKTVKPCFLKTFA